MNFRVPLPLIPFLLSLSLTAAPVQPWPHTQSDLTPDPEVVFGSLPNGLRYAILPNDEPPGRVYLRLHIDAGSLHESENQRGIAHFLEHMVFNGSRNFPNVEALIPQMQRLGIEFGAHANAYTSYDETVYMLDLPSVETPVLDLAFTVLRDFADGALLETGEIENERGVILSELKSRDSVLQRLAEKRLQFMLPDFRATNRHPIGLETVIENAPREMFVDFYKSHYIPSKMTLVAVGDFPPAELERRIRETFKSMENPATLPEPVSLGELPSGTGLRSAVFADEEVPGDTLSLVQTQPYRADADTRARRIQRLPLQAANAALTRRLAILAKAEASPIKSGYSDRSSWLDAVEFHTFSVTPIEGAWPEAVRTLEIELRRALEFGFSETELQEVRANWINALEESVRRAPTRQSRTLVGQLTSALTADRVFNHPEEDLEIFREPLEALTPQMLHAALKKAWSTDDQVLLLTTRSAPEAAAEQLKETFLASRSEPVEAPDAIIDDQFAYSEFGEPGTVIETKPVQDLDFVQYRLNNKIRVNLKQTDFRKNSVNIQVRFGEGKLSQPQDQPGLDQIASTVMNGGGLGAHSNDALRRILAGKNVGYSFGIAEDAFVLSGSTTPDDFPLQLQLMTAFLTDPGYREEALRQFHKQLPALESALKHTLGGAGARMQEWLYGNDPRFAAPDPEALAQYTEADVRAWLESPLKNAYLELTIVGDIAPEAALPELLKTFGALGPRDAEKRNLPHAAHINTPDFLVRMTFTYDSKIDKAVAYCLWKAKPIQDDVRESRRMNVLASIFSDRLRKKIREELGTTYSPSAGFNASDVFNFGYLTASATGTTAQSEHLLQTILEAAQTLGETGATQDELDRALNPILGQLPLHWRENGHWLTILSQSQAEPFRLDWARERDADYASINLETINALARQYLRPENCAQLILTPESR